MVSKLLSALPAFLTRKPVVVSLFGVAIAVVSIFLALASAVTNDTWWHLRTGKDIWEGNFSFIDNLSWTAPGAFWPAHELGFEWLLYGLWQLGGESFFLMSVLNIALVLGALFLLLPPKSLRERYGLNFSIFVPILLAAVGLSLVFFVQVRAQSISFFLFALTIRVILLKRPYWVPLIFFAWVWLHGSVFAGVALMGIATVIFIGRWLLDRKNKLKFKDALHFSLAGILSLVATCLSPLGIGIWKYFLSTLSYKDTLIKEWQPITDNPTIFTIFIVALVLFAGALLVLALKFRKQFLNWQFIFLGLMSIFFMFNAMSAVRVYANFALVALPLLYMAAMTIKRPEKERAPERERTFTIAGIVSLVLGAVVGLYFATTISVTVLNNGSNDPFADGGVVEAMRSEQCTGALWNDYDTGSYMLWFTPDIPVTIDSRYDPYPDWVKEASGVIKPSPGNEDPTKLLNEVFDEHGIQCWVMGRGEDSLVLEKRGLPIIAQNREMIVFEVPDSGIPAGE